MPIEKLPVTSIPNKLIQTITDATAFLIYCYLLSIDVEKSYPRGLKAHLKKHFKIGEHKLNKCFAYLKSLDLLDYKVMSSNGRFTHSQYIVKQMNIF